MRDNQPPEEKLLRLIRKDNKPKLSAQGTGLALEPRAMGSDSLVSRKAQAPRASFQFFLSPRKILPVLFLFSFLYFAVSFFSPVLFPQQTQNLNVSGVSDFKQIKPAPAPRPFDSYEQGVKGRELFAAMAVSATALVSGAKEAAPDLLKDLSLVGVISGDMPQAIIQNKKDQKTYYVAKNGFVGDFQVEEIHEGKVVLGYQGQKYELFL